MANLTSSGIAQLFSGKPLSQPFMRRGPFSICRYQKEEFQQKEPYFEFAITLFNDEGDLGRIIYKFKRDSENFLLEPVTMIDEPFFYNDDDAMKRLCNEAEMLDALVLFNARRFPEEVENAFQIGNLQVKLQPTLVTLLDIYRQISADTGMFMRDYFSYRVSNLQKGVQKL